MNASSSDPRLSCLPLVDLRNVMRTAQGRSVAPSRRLPLGWMRTDTAALDGLTEGYDSLVLNVRHPRVAQMIEQARQLGLTLRLLLRPARLLQGELPEVRDVLIDMEDANDRELRPALRRARDLGASVGLHYNLTAANFAHLPTVVDAARELPADRLLVTTPSSETLSAMATQTALALALRQLSRQPDPAETLFAGTEIGGSALRDAVALCFGPSAARRLDQSLEA